MPKRRNFGFYPRSSIFTNKIEELKYWVFLIESNIQLFRNGGVTVRAAAENRYLTIKIQNPSAVTLILIK